MDNITTGCAAVCCAASAQRRCYPTLHLPTFSNLSIVNKLPCWVFSLWTWHTACGALSARGPCAGRTNKKGVVNTLSLSHTNTKRWEIHIYTSLDTSLPSLHLSSASSYVHPHACQVAEDQLVQYIGTVNACHDMPGVDL